MWAIFHVYRKEAFIGPSRKLVEINDAQCLLQAL